MLASEDAIPRAPLEVSETFLEWTNPDAPVPKATPRTYVDESLNLLSQTRSHAHESTVEWPQTTCIDCGARPPECIETGVPELVSLPCMHFICQPCWSLNIERMDCVFNTPHLATEEMRMSLDRPFCTVCHPVGLPNLCHDCVPAIETVGGGQLASSEVPEFTHGPSVAHSNARMERLPDSSDLTASPALDRGS